MSKSYKVPDFSYFPRGFKLQEAFLFSWLLDRAEGKDMVVLCSIRELCRETRTSITRVYKALQRLDQEGFISIDTLEPQKGIPSSGRTLIRVLKDPFGKRHGNRT